MVDVHNASRPRAAPLLSSGARDMLWVFASVILALGLWAAAVAILQPPAYILPSPWDVLARTWTDRALLFSHGVTTMGEILAGLLLSIVVGIPLGIVIVAIPVVQRLAYPIIIAFNAIPKVALAPLFVVWFGYGLLPRVLLTGSIAFFPILVATITGLTSIEPELLRLAAVLRARQSNIFLHMRVPQAMPSIMSGIKIATSLAVIGGIIAEFVASDRGWGFLLVQASGSLDTTIMLAIIIILAVVASLLFYLISLAEIKLVSWHASQRSI